MRNRAWAALAAVSIVVLLPAHALAERARSTTGATTSTSVDVSAKALDVAVTSVDVEGGLDATVARTVVERHLVSLDRCFKRALESARGIPGDIDLRVLVGRAGQVLSATVESSDLGEQLEKCAMQKAMDLRFGVSKTKAHITVRYSLRFEPPNNLGPIRTTLGPPLGSGGLGIAGTGGGGGGSGGAAAPTIAPGSVAVQGSLSREVIRGQIRTHINEFRFCYEQQLAQLPSLAGRVTIRFVIAPSGQVTTASVASSTVGNPVMEQCLVRTMQRVVFPPPAGGGVVIVTYPFNFQQDPGQAP